jgi:hypothetical protein
MSKVLGPEVGYVDLLDWHLTEKLARDAQGGRKSNPLRPSSAGKCTRELGYEFAEYKGLAKYDREPMQPDTHRLLNLGHSIEWNILKMFEDVEIFEIKYRQQVVSFFQIEPEKWIEGSIDAVIWSPKYKAVIDIKSKGDRYSSWSRSQWSEHDEKFRNMASVQTLTERAFWISDLASFLDEVNDPFLASNFYQLNLYANTQFIKERGIDHAAVVQYNKGDSRLRELRFLPSEDVYRATQDKFKLVAAAQSPSDLPRDHALGSIKCAYCPFKNECWNEDALKAYWATWPKKKWPDDADDELNELYSRYKEVANSSKELSRLEKLIALDMEEKQIAKVKFEDGAIYELKNLKSEGLVIRRTKL